MKIDIITPSGGHGGCIALCARRVAAQSLTPKSWRIEIGPDWVDNVAELIRSSSADAVAVFDDDDYYDDDYLEATAHALRGATLVGHRLSRTYHLGAAAYTRFSVPRGPLPGTMALRRELFPEALALLKSRRSIKDLWQNRAGHVIEADRVFGVKGIPGRPSLSVKHEFSESRYPDRDFDRSYLVSQVGEATAREYLDMLSMSPELEEFLGNR